MPSFFYVGFWGSNSSLSLVEQAHLPIEPHSRPLCQVLRHVQFSMWPKTKGDLHADIWVIVSDLLFSKTLFPKFKPLSIPTEFPSSH